jgi:hypothetical protein
MSYVNCPRCSTYQPFGEGICKICGAELQEGNSITNSYSTPPPTTPIMSVSGPPMSFIDNQADLPPFETGEGVHDPHEQYDEFPEPGDSSESIVLYGLVKPEVVDNLKRYEWFNEETHPCKFKGYKGYFFVPLTRLEEVYG